MHPRADKTSAVVGEKNCFVEVSKRSFYSQFGEPQDSYFSANTSQALQQHYKNHNQKHTKYDNIEANDDTYITKQQQYQNNNNNKINKNNSLDMHSGYNSQLDVSDSPLFAPKDLKDQMIAHDAELLPPCKTDERSKGIAKRDLTEEALDDWVAQSIHRSIPEMLDPKKKFQLPYRFIDDLKTRYPHLIPQVQPVNEDEEEQFLTQLLSENVHFDRKQLAEKKKQFNMRKVNMMISDQLFANAQAKNKIYEIAVDPNKLEPKLLKGSKLQSRLRGNQSICVEQKTNNSNNSGASIRRRGTTIFNPSTPYQFNNNDTTTAITSPTIDYQSLSIIDQPKTTQQSNRSRQSKSLQTQNGQQRVLLQQQQQQLPASLFSMNITNFLRTKNDDNNIETSIVEQELAYIQGLTQIESKKKSKKKTTNLKEMQKANRDEASKIANQTINYFVNPPDLPPGFSYPQPVLIPVDPEQSYSATQSNTIYNSNSNTRRPQTQSSNMNSTKNRFFMLTKLQTKPNTPNPNVLTGKNRRNQDRMNTTTIQVNQTTQGKSGFYSMNTTMFPMNDKQQKVFNRTARTNSCFSKVQDKLELASLNTTTITGNSKTISNNNNNNQEYFYSSLISYQRQKSEEASRKRVLKELSKDYVNTDANKTSALLVPKVKEEIKNKQKERETNQQQQQQQQQISILNDQPPVPAQSKSDLPIKVERLLNSGSEDILIKPNDDFANLMLHLEEIPIDDKQPESAMSNSEFWLHKSQKLINKGQTEVATQCLKQVLIVDKLNFVSLYNMGSLYEKIKKFRTALDWLKLSKEFDPSHEQTLFGIALCLYKIKEFDASYNGISKLIDAIREKDEPPSKYIYLRALCLKQLNRLPEAEDDYKIFYKKTSPNNFDLLMKLMILFSFKYRNRIAKYSELEIKYSARIYCQFNTAIQQIVQGEYFAVKLQGFYLANQKVWHETESLLQTLSTLSFFKRLPHTLLRKSLLYLSPHLIEKEKLINPNSNEVYVIISGSVQVFDHSKNYEKPDIVSYYTEGDIIGCDHLENNLSNKANVWLITQTPVEYLRIDKDIFYQLWKGQYTLQGEYITTLLQNCLMMKNISHITLYKLTYELVKMEEYKMNEIIYNDGTFLAGANVNNIQMVKKSKKRSTGVMQRVVAIIQGQQSTSLLRTYRLRKLIYKHMRQIRLMMWNTKIIRGFYIIVQGIVQIENEIGWTYVLTPGDFFGENLIFKTKGLANYGRITAVSENVKMLLLPRDRFSQINSLDKALMKKNCQKREQIEGIEYMVKRFKEIREIKIARKKQIQLQKADDNSDEEFLEHL